MAAIQVLGTGCAKCTQLVKSAQKAVDELGRGDTVEKIIDIMKVFEFAPSALPALAIDGKVVSSGTLLTHDQIKQLLVSPR